MKKFLAILLAVLMVTFAFAALAEEAPAAVADAAASDAAAAAPQAAGLGEILSMFLPLLLMVVIFYFLLIRPQKKKEKKVKEMLDALSVGDRICTIGGIYGTITAIKDDTMELSVGRNNTQLVIARWAIRNKEEVSVENDAELLN